MLDTPVLNVAIGLVFCFAATALAASTVTEAIASLLKLRANALVAGVQKMLNDPNFNGLALQIYNHALVHPQGDGKIVSGNRFWTYAGPSYIKAQDFATAAIDVLQQTAGDAARLKANVDAFPDPQMRQLLQGMLARAAGDMEHLHAQVADWFDTAMNRVSGSYKRRAQLISFLIGLVIATTVNVDATHVVGELWANPSRAKAFAGTLAPDVAAAPGAAGAQRALQQLETLPVGPAALKACDGSERACIGGHAVGVYNVLGWLITAVASVFGAPFWFDMLQKLVQVRGSGPKPGETRKTG